MAIISDREWLIERIAAKRALVVALEGAITALAINGVQNYQLDTGQTRQLVTKTNLSALRESLAEAESELAVLEARLHGGAVTRVIPGW